MDGQYAAGPKKNYKGMSGTVAACLTVHGRCVCSTWKEKKSDGTLVGVTGTVCWMHKEI